VGIGCFVSFIDRWTACKPGDGLHAHPKKQRRILVPLDGSALAESIIDGELTVSGARNLVLIWSRVFRQATSVHRGVAPPLQYPSSGAALWLPIDILHAVSTRLASLV
jgi:hypothetical protein